MDEQVTSTPTMADYYGMIKAEHEANNAWSAEQAQKAMDYQTQMSNTAHQREVADLKAAGLNPILSAGGQGATTGTGQAAQRSDSNIDALYGLTKMAIESNIAQANAMASTAKYSSGHAGNATPYSVADRAKDDLLGSVYSAFDSLASMFGGSSSKKEKSSSEKSNNSNTKEKTTGTQYWKDYYGDWFPVVSLVGDVAKKVFGVDKETTYAGFQAIEKATNAGDNYFGNSAWRFSPAAAIASKALGSEPVTAKTLLNGIKKITGNSSSTQKVTRPKGRTVKVVK